MSGEENHPEGLGAQDFKITYTTTRSLANSVKLMQWASGAWSVSGLVPLLDENKVFSYFSDMPKMVQLFADPLDTGISPQVCTGSECATPCGETCETCKGDSAHCMSCPAGKVL